MNNKIEIDNENKNNKLLDRLNKGKKVGNDMVKEEEKERERGKLIIKEKAKKLEEGLVMRENQWKNK